MTGQLRLLSGRKLISPIGKSTRPTTSIVRESLMNIVRSKIINSNWLDLYSGSGVIGCEAIQAGASSVLAVEINKKAYQICKSNLYTVNKASHKKVSVKVINSEANRFLKEGFEKYSEDMYKRIQIKPSRFNFIYIDPPYKSDSYCSTLENLLRGKWVEKECLAICEFSIFNQIKVPSKWIMSEQKNYGKTGLMLLTPNQA
ncbi:MULTISPECIES: 16S rRNA (guanine(966)-N(2))-methyltransferase RsmD [unclassified Prochlorococcus]|uniref:16S rRNA (guanine(966)-N(2))-methyltransferase RsmD n=1 Tax=unclassified Prochlorococcus TaxID=2627481 RepID=UPI0005339B6E|nr:MULTISPECIES: 16S rRNA (guanine(966)-N(2))-methyltransferase RsmD [unclassified Prochlorococcus]KGG15468.1 Ribosomal RNA small subunit methyltransferase D [Prochlorococcus sp. MIT 0602]KGG17748.1 Ribosomal RNA small subunit methyltransferase D [Prochlorococcus sp. MIT 0603]